MEASVVGFPAKQIGSASQQIDLDDFFDNGAICLHSVDASGVILAANRAELDLLGYPAEEYIGRPIAKFHVDADAIAHILQTLSAGQRLQSYPARLRARDGSIKHVLITSSVRFENGAFINSRCFSVDVTAAVEAEAARREAEERLKSTYEKATVGLCETDAAGRYVHVNPVFVELSGLPREALVGRHFNDLTHPDDRAEDVALYDDQVAGRLARYSLEKRYVRADGSVIFVEVSSSSVLDAHGAFKYAVRVVKDVTVRREAEERLQQSERRLHALLGALPMAVYTTDAAGKLTYFNEAAARMAGRQPRLGEDEWCVSWKLYWPDGRPLPHDQCPMAIAIRTGEELRGVEAVLERPDGERRVFTPFPTLLRDSAGKVVGAVNVLVDITVLKQADEQQKLLVDELNHRVKNTLATVQSISLQTHKSSPEAFIDRFEARLMALSRTHNLLTDRQWHGVELKGLIEAEFSPFAEASGALVEYAGPKVELAAREGLALGMVLHELATNAAKYGALARPEGRICVRWEVEAKLGRPRLHLSWVERCGPAVKPPTRRGFGRQLIERSIFKELQGDVTMAFEAEGLDCQMQFGLSLPQPCVPLER